MSDKSSVELPRPKCPKRLLFGFGLMAFASFSGLAWMVTVAFRKVLAGEGLETYRTFWLVEFNWIGFLIAICAVLVALVVAIFLAWRENRLWRDFERKYGANKDA